MGLCGEQRESAFSERSAVGLLYVSQHTMPCGRSEKSKISRFALIPLSRSLCRARHSRRLLEKPLRLLFAEEGFQK